MRSVARTLPLAVLLPALAVLAGAKALAQETVLSFDGEVDVGDGVAYFALPFDVPEGVAEIEIRHDDLSAENILDWGLLGPDGAFRGYGGGNPEPAVTATDAASRSYLAGPIEAGPWQVYVGEAKVTELPARYHVEVVLREVATLAPQAERAPYAPGAPTVTTARWYAGDFHVHSRESGDASATFDEIIALARERGLDFVELSEHNTTSQLDFVADLAARAPDLLVLPGVEVTTYEGHANAIGLTRWVDHRIGVAGRSMTDVAEEVLAEGALFAPNHPELNVGDRCIGCGWEAEVDGALLSAMELQTGDADGPAGFLQPLTFARWEALVADGHHVAAIGGSDDHSAGRETGSFAARIGTPATFVFAEELSAAALLAGIRDGRTVVVFEGTTGPMIELDAGGRAGDTVVADAPALSVVVTGATESMDLQLVKNGVVVERVPTLGEDPFAVELPVYAPAEGEDAWRAEVVIGRARQSVTSHLFVRAETAGWVPPAEDAGPGSGDASVDAAGGDAAADAGSPPGGSGGCGCAVDRPGEARARWVIPFALLVAGARRRRRRA